MKKEVILSANNGESAINIKQLSKHFNNVVAVDNLSLKISHNTTYALLGPNGAGKTTTISILTTLARPTNGTALIDGFDVVTEAAKVRSLIGVTFQELILDDALTGRQILDYHGKLYGLNAKIRRKRIEELLALVELSDASNRKCKVYSGGMKRRLELVRALMTEPSVLFLDEPTLGLDPKGRASVWEYIRKLKQKTNMTLLLTTHYLEEAERLADKVGIMDKGKLVVEGKPSDLIEELGADTICILGKDHSKDIKKELSSFDYIQSFSRVNNGILLGVKSSSKHLAEIITVISKIGFIIEDISVSKPDLGAVFFKYTGHALRNEDKEGVVHE
jgi:ABC-2 type transport system ATP-binding protein